MMQPGGSHVNQPVSVVSLPLPANAAQETGGNLATLAGAVSGGKVQVSGTFWQTTQPVSGTFWQTTVPVSGTFWQATQPVSGTFWQATQPVSIAATVTTSDAHLPAAAALGDTVANPTTTLIGGCLMGWDATNTEWR